jgi:hypothetical protein
LEGSGSDHSSEPRSHWVNPFSVVRSPATAHPGDDASLSPLVGQRSILRPQSFRSVGKAPTNRFCPRVTLPRDSFLKPLEHQFHRELFVVDALFLRDLTNHGPFEAWKADRDHSGRAYLPSRRSRRTSSAITQDSFRGKGCGQGSGRRIAMGLQTGGLTRNPGVAVSFPRHARI